MDNLARDFKADRRTPPACRIHHGAAVISLAGSPDLPGEVIATVTVGGLLVARHRVDRGQVEAVARFLEELAHYTRGHS